jgi:hypothetical protein
MNKEIRIQNIMRLIGTTILCLCQHLLWLWHEEPVLKTKGTQRPIARVPAALSGPVPEGPRKGARASQASMFWALFNLLSLSRLKMAVFWFLANTEVASVTDYDCGLPLSSGPPDLLARRFQRSSVHAPPLGLEVASVTGYDWSIPFLQNSRRRLHASVRSRRIRPLHDGVLNRIGRTISECAVIFRAASTSAS